jgi:hypothetical protein
MQPTIQQRSCSRVLLTAIAAPRLLLDALNRCETLTGGERLGARTASGSGRCRTFERVGLNGDPDVLRWEIVGHLSAACHDTCHVIAQQVPRHASTAPALFTRACGVQFFNLALPKRSATLPIPSATLPEPSAAAPRT